MGMAQIPGKGGPSKGVTKGPASKTQPSGPTTLKLVLAPDIKSMQDPAPVKPDANGLYEIPVAGKTVAV